MTIQSILKSFLIAAIAAVGVSGGRSSAANGDIDRENGIVYISGDNYRDVCYIRWDGDDIEIELTVYDENGEVDDTDDRSYDVDDVFGIVFHGFGGNDYFNNLTDIPCTAMGGAGNDTLIGGSGDDVLYGGEDNDWLYGLDGEDDLYGDGGCDGLFGGRHGDYLKAGKGEDEYYIFGQGGPDIFATPATISWRSRQLIPLNRNVWGVDFNPNEDTEALFFAPVFSLISSPIILP